MREEREMMGEECLAIALKYAGMLEVIYHDNDIFLWLIGEHSTPGHTHTGGDAINLHHPHVPNKGVLGTVTRKFVRAKSGPGGPLLVAKNGPGCQKWSGYISLQETSPCTVKFVNTHGVLLNMIRGDRCVH